MVEVVGEMGWLKFSILGEPAGGYGLAIAGYPGVANVGAGVVTYLSEELGAEPLARLYSEYLFLPGNVAGISISEDGSFELPSIDIYHTREEVSSVGRLLLITSQVQPVPWGQLEVASKLLGKLKSLGASSLLVVTGFADPDIAGRVLAFGTNSDLLQRIISAGAEEKTPMKSIVGLAGATLASAKLFDLPYVSLTGVSETSAPDFRAAGEVLKILNSALDLQLNLGSIERRIREFEEMKRSILRQLEEQISSMTSTGSDETGYVG